MNLFIKISNCHFPTIPNIGLLPKKICTQLFERVTRVVLNILSPKHSIRPETFTEILEELVVNLRTHLAYAIWSISSLLNKSSKESRSYLNVLSILSKNEPLLDGEKLELHSFFSLPCVYHLGKFDFIIHSNEDSQIKKLHKSVKDLFTLCNLTCFTDFKAKLARLVEIRSLEEVGPLPENEKLTLFDFNFIQGFSSIKDVYLKLKDIGINGIEGFGDRLDEVEKLLSHSFFDNLKRLCKESLTPGMIFLGDRLTLQTLNAEDFNCRKTIHHLCMGRICHIGIFVAKEETGFHLSHVNRITNTHAVMPIKNPLGLLFAHKLMLNIRPLLPVTLSENQKQKLIDAFFIEFNRLASEEHPTLFLANTSRHLKMAFMGHKMLFPQDLAQIELPPKNNPIMCSSYVGIIFLKAVQKMNQILENDGLKERIPHPFGRHENVMNLDILRLLYLWKKLKVINSLSCNEKLAKIVSSQYEFLR